MNTGQYHKNMRMTKELKQDTQTLKSDTHAIKESVEKLPAEVVKQLVIPLANQTADLMDAQKEQADRLERNITKNVVEQLEAKLTARWGPSPHPGGATSSAGPLDRQLHHATKLKKGAELAAAKATKRAKDTPSRKTDERAAAMEERANAKAEQKRENTIVKLSKH